MGKRIYVGNLSETTTSAMLQEMFAPFGTVDSANVIEGRGTARGKNFAFVEMSSDAEAAAAIAALNGKESDGRSLKVNEARGRNA